MLSSPGVVGLDIFCHFTETRSRLPASLLHTPGTVLAAPSQDSPTVPPGSTRLHHILPQKGLTKFIVNHLQCQFPLCNKGK